jgi:hypothetical protein
MNYRLLFGDARMLEYARQILLLHYQKLFFSSFIFQTFEFDALVKNSLV